MACAAEAQRNSSQRLLRRFLDIESCRRGFQVLLEPRVTIFLVGLYFFPLFWLFIEGCQCYTERQCCLIFTKHSVFQYSPTDKVIRRKVNEVLLNLFELNFLFNLFLICG